MERNHSLDAARGFLMVLGVVLHAANIYAPGIDWLVNDPQTHPLFDWVAGAIHAFRMPAFFWISGYFTAQVLRRDTAPQRFGQRLQRLCIPFLFTLLVLNTVQLLLVPAGDADGGWLPPLFQLWFLADLIVFTLGWQVLVRTGLWDRLCALVARLLPSKGWVEIVAFGIAAWLLSAMVRATGFAYQDLGGVTSAYRLAEHLPFFMLGAYMFVQRSKLGAFTRLPWWLLPLAITATMLVEPHMKRGAPLMQETATVAVILLKCICVGAVMSAFRALFSRPSELTRSLSESAYTVYLLHHGIVVVLGSALVLTDAPPWLGFAAIVLVAAVGPYLFWRFAVRRSSVLSWLFNGRGAGDKAKRAAATARSRA